MTVRRKLLASPAVYLQTIGVERLIRRTTLVWYVDVYRIEPLGEAFSWGSAQNEKLSFGVQPRMRVEVYGESR